MVWEGRSREAPPYPDCATALRVTAAPWLRLKASGMAERLPFGPSTRAEPTTPLFPRKQRRPSDRPASRPGREAAKRTLDGEDRSGIIQGEGKGGRL